MTEKSGAVIFLWVIRIAVHCSQILLSNILSSKSRKRINSDATVTAF